MDPVLASVRHRLMEQYDGDGEWKGNLGDATAWAPAFLLGCGDASGAERDAADAALRRERRLLLQVRGPVTVREEAALGVMGLLASARRGEKRDLRRAQAAVGVANTWATANGGYLSRPASTHGPTAATAVLAYGNILLAPLVHGPARIVHGRFGAWLLDRVGKVAFHDGGGYYRAWPDERRLEALPNLLMITALARAAKLRRDRDLLQRARDVEEVVRGALWDRDHGAFLTSEEADPDVMLSVQNFAMLAYRELGRADPRHGWRERAEELLRFVTKNLPGRDGLLAHDWHVEKGPAKWSCTGCNYQTLYVADLVTRKRRRW